MKNPLYLFIFLFTALNCSDSNLEKAKAIHERVITLDTHADINVSNFTAEQNYTMDLSTQVTLPKMESGGLDVVYFIVYTGQDTLSEEGYAYAYENAISKFDAIHRLTEEIAPDRIELALTSADVKRIIASGKKVAMIGVENGYPIGTDLSRVKEFYDRGARYMSLSHNGHSQLSDSNTGSRDSVWLHNGVSEFGEEVIKEMNKWGIMIDLSHPSKEANLQTMKLSKAPVIASHSSARAVNDVSRNLSDEELLALKENGGVAQTVAFKSYVDTEKNAAFQEASDKILAEVLAEQGMDRLSRSEMRTLPQEEMDAYITKYRAAQELAKPRIEAEVTSPPVDVSDFINHLDYMVQLIGIDHVGISSDFDGGGGVAGWNDASETLNVTLELLKRGYTEEEIGKLWSGNLLRVLDEVQAIAKSIQEGAM